MRKGTVIISGFLILHLLTFGQMSMTTVKAQNIQTKANAGIIAPCADVVETRYRIMDGRLQYRRWNATRRYWVDEKWIDV